MTATSERKVDICKPVSRISGMDGIALFVVQFLASYNVTMRSAYNYCGPLHPHFLRWRQFTESLLDTPFEFVGAMTLSVTSRNLIMDTKS